MGKLRVRNLLHPLISRQGKTLCTPFQRVEICCTPPPPPFNMAKTSRCLVKTTPRLVVPPLQHAWLKLFPPPPPPPLFRRGKTSHAPLPFCSPPPPPFHIISDQSLTTRPMSRHDDGAGLSRTVVMTQSVYCIDNRPVPLFITVNISNGIPLTPDPTFLS